jgi:hypothetical protein
MMKLKVTGVAIGRERYVREFLVGDSVAKPCGDAAADARMAARLALEYVRVERGAEFAGSLVDVEVEFFPGRGPPSKMSYVSLADPKPRAAATEKRGKR